MNSGSRAVLLIPLLIGCAPAGSDVEQPAELAAAAAPLDPPVAQAIDVPAQRAIATPFEARPEDLPASRRRFTGELRLLWARTSSDQDSVLLTPTDLHFAREGLLVFDAADRRIRVFDAGTGRHLRSAGREGQGPGEFNVSFWFQGSFDRPASFDATLRRITLLHDPEGGYVSRSLPTGYHWVSTCALDSSRTIGTVFSRTQPDYLVSEGDRVIDSLAIPWEEFRGKEFMLRQTRVRQLDDTSCIMLATYQDRFAVFDPGAGFRVGTYPESATVVQLERTTLADGRSVGTYLPRGARRAASDGRAWRDHVIVLSGGRTRLADRLLDVYRRSDLAYQGSLVLPMRADRIAVHGDTLVVIGEHDDYPVLAAYLIGRSR